MSEFEPPTFSFVGLQFNADIFENPLTGTGGTPVIPDTLSIGELNTIFRLHAVCAIIFMY